jgi:uncharacterized protein (DUF58 family)
MRHVHWPATARHGSLVVREMQRDGLGSLVALVDTWSDAGDPETALDLCCTVAGSVAVAALADGREVHLGAGAAGRVSGPVPVRRSEALRFLAGLAPRGGPPFPAVVEEVASRSFGPASFLLVMPTWKQNEPAALQRALGPLLARGAGVMVVAVGAASFRPRTPVLTPAQEGELERALRQAGADLRWVRSAKDVASLERPARWGP